MYNITSQHMCLDHGISLSLSLITYSFFIYVTYVLRLVGLQCIMNGQSFGSAEKIEYIII